MKKLFLPLAAIILCLVSALGLQAPAHKQHRSQPTTGTPDTQKKTKLYIIRVIDSASRTPINKARVTVELDNPAKTKWTGLTDANGFFEFKWDVVTPAVKAHTSIEAHGFASLDSYNVLIEDRIISLTRLSAANPSARN